MPVSLPGIPVEFRPWPGFLLLVIQAGFVVIAALAADGLVKVASESGFGWRQPVGGVVAVLALELALVVIGRRIERAGAPKS